MTTGAEAEKYLNQGVEAMRKAAVEIVASYLVNVNANPARQWSAELASNLLNDIAGDIQMRQP